MVWSGSEIILTFLGLFQKEKEEEKGKKRFCLIKWRHREQKKRKLLFSTSRSWVFLQPGKYINDSVFFSLGTKEPVRVIRRIVELGKRERDLETAVSSLFHEVSVCVYD